MVVQNSFFATAPSAFAKYFLPPSVTVLFAAITPSANVQYIVPSEVVTTVSVIFLPAWSATYLVPSAVCTMVFFTISPASLTNMPSAFNVTPVTTVLLIDGLPSPGLPEPAAVTVILQVAVMSWLAARTALITAFPSFTAVATPFSTFATVSSLLLQISAPAEIAPEVVIDPEVVVCGRTVCGTTVCNTAVTERVLVSPSFSVSSGLSK